MIIRIRGLCREVPFIALAPLGQDNATNQKVTLQILNNAVVNRQEAPVALECQAYDTVFMDVEMPVMDGITATRKIRERWPGNGPKIIANTA